MSLSISRHQRRRFTNGPNSIIYLHILCLLRNGLVVCAPFVLYCCFCCPRQSWTLLPMLPRCKFTGDIENITFICFFINVYCSLALDLCPVNPIIVSILDIMQLCLQWPYWYFDRSVKIFVYGCTFLVPYAIFFFVWNNKYNMYH